MPAANENKDLQSSQNATGVTEIGARKVTVMRDSSLPYPELWLDVYVAGDSYDQIAFADLFVRASCRRARTPEKADLVVFTGGVDVDPSLYGEEKYHTTHFDKKRDEMDMNLYKTCLEEGIPMFGVCRGAQFLHVMNGGKLYQDVDNHTGDHGMWDVRAKKMIQNVSSVHHQSCIPNKEGGMELLAEAFKSKVRWMAPNKKEDKSSNDVEAFFYRDTCCFGVQGHPEYRGYYNFARWTLDQLYDLVVTNPDVHIKDRMHRLKPDILAMRDKNQKQKLKGLN